MAEIDETLSRLPHMYEKQKDEPGKPRNLWKFLSIFTSMIDELREVKEQVRQARDIDQASGKTLDFIGSNVQQVRGKTKDAVYRSLIKTKIARNISNGAVNNLITIIAISTGCLETEVEIIERFELVPPTPASIGITLPDYVLNNMAMSPGQFTSLMEKIVGAGIRVESLYEGTFRFSNNDTVPELNSDTGFDAGTLGAYYSSGAGDELPI